MAEIKDRRERLIIEALDTYGPRVLNIRMAELLCHAAELLMRSAIYDQADLGYKARLAAVDVDLVTHYMAARYCPLLEDWETAITLRLDNLERWTKSEKVKKVEA